MIIPNILTLNSIQRRAGGTISVLNLQPISEDQDFLYPSDAVTGDYVGKVKVYPVYDMIGSTPVFELKTNVRSIYAVSSTGIISISNPGGIAVGTDTIIVTVSKSGYNPKDLSISIECRNSALCTYIDPSSGTNGAGTRANPKNVPPVLASTNQTYLFKRGTRATLSATITSFDATTNGFTAGAYGTGTNPIIDGTTTLFNIYGGADGFVIRDLEMCSIQSAIDTPTHAAPSYYTNWTTAVYGSGFNNAWKNITVKHCYMHHCQPIAAIANDPPGPATNAENFTGSWNTISYSPLDGINMKNIQGTINANCNHITYNNLVYWFDQGQTVANGDPIQTYHCDITNIKHNYIDKSTTGQKFNIIIDQTSSASAEAFTGWVSIEDNYFISTPEGSSIIMWLYFKNGNVSRNIATTTNNIEYFVMHGGSSIDTTYDYNIIYNGQIRDTASAAKIYNNVFISPIRCVTNGWGALEFKNNIVLFSSNTQVAYTNSDVGSADYNLYSDEHSNMFGTGLNTVSSVSPKETHSIVGDPLLVDIGNNDLRPSSTSPVIGAGAYVGRSLDYYYRTVLPEPSIGVSEYLNSYTPSAPVLQSINMLVDGTKVELTFNKPMANPAGKHGQFTFNSGKTASAAALKSGNSAVIQLTMSVAYVYADPDDQIKYDAGTVTSAFAEALASFSYQSFVNTVPSTNIFSDDFQSYADASNLGDSANWDTSGQTSMQVYFDGSTNVVRPTGNTYHIDKHVGTFASDQYSKAIQIAYTNGSFSGVGLRISGTYGSNLYGIFYEQDNGTRRCYKFVNNTYTLITTAEVTTSTNKVLEIRIVGNNVTFYYDGAVDTAMATSGVYNASGDSLPAGNPGVCGYGNLSNFNKLDTWEGGDL